MILDKAMAHRSATNVVTGDGIGHFFGKTSRDYSEAAALRLGDVSRCVEILSNDMAKLPWFMMDEVTKERTYTGDLMRLLRIRPNEAMAPFTVKQMVEADVLLGGNGYIWIIRNRISLQPEELIPVPCSLVTPHRERSGMVWYQVQDPGTHEPFIVFSSDMIHLKGFTRDGLNGLSVLSRAREVIASGNAAQEYQTSFYEHGGQPSGVLQTDSDLGGYVDVPSLDGTMIKKSKRDIVRDEWERIHGGAANSHRVAVLDFGLKYSPITVTQADAQFVQTKSLNRIDIANFFGVPLYKLNDGKQAYSSNEQNSTEYVVSTLQPKVSQWEEEFSYKLLFDSDLNAGKRLRMNMMVALRGDSQSRGNWYKAMREMGCFSVNDILGLEDMPNVQGGDTRYASLNYVPLEAFKRLSENRNRGE